MQYCCDGGKPLTGKDNSNKMREECLNHKLISISDGSWGNNSFATFGFDNGYVVEIQPNGKDNIYENKTKMSFDLFMLERGDGYQCYFICEQNAQTYYDIQIYKQNLLHPDGYYNFKKKPQKVHLRLTCYELRDLKILDQDYNNEHDRTWIEYINYLRDHPEKTYMKV